MFSLIPDASKVAVWALCSIAERYSFPFIDCQISNPFLASLGAEEMHRDRYLAILARSVKTEESPLARAFYSREKTH